MISSGPAVVHFLHDRYYAIVAVFIGLTGIALVQESDSYGWSDKFIYMGFAAIVLGGSIGGGYLKGMAKKRIAALEAGNTAEAAALHKRTTPAEIFLTGFAFLTILAMVSKWGL